LGAWLVPADKSGTDWRRVAGQPAELAVTALNASLVVEFQVDFSSYPDAAGLVVLFMFAHYRIKGVYTDHIDSPELKDHELAIDAAFAAPGDLIAFVRQ